ncbi:hypothetical protein M409DRAFT_18502 [Zasmidium cellare ATCC 36951]|uniref:Ribosomal RNA-processing protein 1 n=1 Tax=Zasmidium cellare ATCC 36951 TaxID=1080233 RepID=A0A6A6CZY4_ZASCE|nr:uncharacterized protein M409DRAFT_18502 [Zasmidium cellare ATCC 36951]KAF2171389.1 hypothetical protein M409DRAFT_18502 [Zasmidium cellare ATCC 36951]
MAATKTSTSSQSNPFIKQLASSNRTTRDRALSSLRTYLHRPTPFTPLDLLKLWKGLFYCMFMSDKPRNQQALARDLASLVDELKSVEGKIGFIEAFWKTMAREWNAIDSLRMDKYLYLIRCFVGKGFEVCRSQGWSEEVLKMYEGVLREEGGPLSPRDGKVPGGLKLHVLDVWVDELEKVDEKREADVGWVMWVVRKLAKESLVKSVRERAKEAIEDERLEKGKAWKKMEEDVEEEEDEADEGDFGGFED